VGVGQAIFSSADEATVTRWMLFGIDGSGRLFIDNNNNDTRDVVSGTTTTFVADRWYHLAVVSTGTAWALYVNGVAEALTVDTGSNTGDWLADVSNRDNVCVGILRRSTLAQYFNGEIGDITYWNRALSAEEILDLAKNRAFDY